MRLSFESVGDARQRLDSSIIRWDEIPVYVRYVERRRVGDERKICIVISPLDELDEEVCVPVDDERIDMTPVPLGYINLENSVQYLFRRPERRFCQGLRLDRIGVKEGNNIFFDSDALKALHNTILNIYPTFDEAISMTRKRKEVAFDRRFSIRRNGDLFYCGRHAGKFDMNKTKSPIWNVKYRHLQEMFEEVLNENS